MPNLMNYDFTVQQPNYGNIAAQAQGIKNLQNRNVLNQQEMQLNSMKIRDYEGSREAAAKKAEFDRRLEATKIIIQSKDNKTARTVAESFGYGDDYKDINVEDPENVDIAFSNGTHMKMPRQKALEWIDFAIADPKGELAANELLQARSMIDAGAEFYKAGADKKTEQLTLRNIADPTKTKRITIAEGETYTPDEGWTIGSLPSKTSLRVGPDGSVEFSQGGELTVKTRGNIEEKLMATNEQMARMLSIKDTFKPEYQQIPTRLGFAWDTLTERMGAELPEDTVLALNDFYQYKRRAQENINLYIKEITGAQMSIKEAKRLEQAQPKPGENWYSGDSPTQFMAKMDDVLYLGRAAQARYAWYKNKGLEDREIVEMIMKDEAKSLDEIVEALRERDAQRNR